MSRFARRAGAVAPALLVLLVACGGARTGADPTPAFRAELADAEAYPLRDGLALDDDALGRAIRQFGEAHREHIRARLAASAADLLPGESPSGPWFRALVTVAPAALSAVAATLSWFEVLEPDVRTVVRRTLTLTLPAAMAEDVSAEPALAARWLAFLTLAEPTWRNCGQDEDHLSVCAEYGGVDIFVVELLRSGYLWLPVAVTWWQRAS